MNIQTATHMINVLGPMFGVLVAWSIFSGNGPLFVAKMLLRVTVLAPLPPMIDFS